MRVLTAVAMVAAASSAHADPADPRAACVQPDCPAPLPPPALEPKAEPGHRVPVVGTLLGLAGAAAPIAAIAAFHSCNEVPNTDPTSSSRTMCDHDHQAHALEIFTLLAIAAPSAGQWYAGRPASLGLVLRAAGCGIAGLTLSVVIGSDEAPAAFGMIALGGLAVCAAGAIYDIATASGAVGDWNRAHAVTPTVMSIGGGYGAGLGFTF